MTLELTKYSDNIFSSNVSGSYHKRAIFGGTILGQSILASYNTVDSNMHLHSFQVYFLIKGNTNDRIDYVVESIMDGRSFVKRSVSVKQNDLVIAKIYLSFKLDEPPSQFVYIPEFPKIIGPNECQLVTDVIEQKLVTHKEETLINRLQSHAEWLNDFPVFIKPVDPDVQTLCKANTTNKIYKWLKLRDDNLIDLNKKSSKHALLGFISDYVILQPILTMHCFESVGFMVSLDHIMWFHCHSFDPKQWLLLEAECNIAKNGTTLNSGRIWSEEGILLATVMQEGIIRPQKIDR